MKTIFTFLVLLFATSAMAQTIRRVNADVTVTGTNVYHTIQAAHDAATAGDVLIVEPNATSVGDLNCTKALTIYGRGYYLDKNASYSAMANSSTPSTVGTISINSNNVKIYGLTTPIGNVLTIYGVSNITIAKCNIYNSISISGGSSGTVNNILITQNYIQSTGVSIGASPAGLVSNITISNNLMANGYLSISDYTSGILVNQNLMANPFYGSVYNSVFTNNIFLNGVAATNVNSINTTYNYNVFTNTSSVTGVGANNIFLSNLGSQFVNNSGGSADNNYRVSNGSPLKTAGSSGGEVGPYGGATPYVQYGIPAGPTVLKLINTGLGNATTPITATISATSNN